MRATNCINLAALAAVMIPNPGELKIGCPAAFVVAVAGCMADLATNTVPLTLPTALTANSNEMLARALNSGIFEVRSGGFPGGPVYGRNKSGTTRAVGLPAWGVETQTVSSNWPGTGPIAARGQNSVSEAIGEGWISSLPT